MIGVTRRQCVVSRQARARVYPITAPPPRAARSLRLGGEHMFLRLLDPESLGDRFIWG